MILPSIVSTASVESPEREPNRSAVFNSREMLKVMPSSPTISFIISFIISSSEESVALESLASIAILFPDLKDIPSSSEFSSSEFSSLLLFGIISPITVSNVSAFTVRESSTFQKGITKYAKIESTQRTEMIRLQIAIFFFKGFFAIIIIPPHTRACPRSLFYHVAIILSLSQQKVNGFYEFGK